MVAPAEHGAAGALHPAFDEVGFADDAAVQDLLDDTVVLVPPAVLVDGKELAGFLGDSHDLLQLRSVQGDGLFADDVLAGPQALDGQIFMEIIGHRDSDQVHFLVVQQLFQGGICVQPLLLRGSQSLRADVVSPFGMDFRQAVLDILVMPAAHAAESNDCPCMFHKNTSGFRFLSSL